ncbi:hypothetical protein BLA60_21665 [Actinophytocola xinjiangensis]|uniref:Uncharacterized protein n=1 Tax=Actinophytocola xinjiangensis TaxID=485602 RepID=A0A7Z1AY45_9PSEU|nr:hypothetical protein [Actinophytocola xinjiangensis]OLF09181.1 hypothetical protein BLA60_21665 [Actinophytocola xinjiangensis]
MVAPDPADELADSTRRVRALLDLLTAYDHTLTDSVATAPALTPPNWRGPASDAYHSRARTPFTNDLTALHGVTTETLHTVAAHQTFQAELTVLWQDASERPHMRQVHQTATTRLADYLLSRAADLDNLTPPDQPPATTRPDTPFPTTTNHLSDSGFDTAAHLPEPRGQLSDLPAAGFPRPDTASLSAPGTPSHLPEPRPGDAVPGVAAVSTDHSAMSSLPEFAPDPGSRFDTSGHLSEPRLGDGVDSDHSPGGEFRPGEPRLPEPRFGGPGSLPELSADTLPEPRLGGGDPPAVDHGASALTSVLDPADAGADSTPQAGLAGGLRPTLPTAARDEQERATYLRTMPPATVLTDVKWDGDD